MLCNKHYKHDAYKHTYAQIFKKTNMSEPHFYMLAMKIDWLP